MLIGGKEINDINEALGLLSEEQRAHQERVAKYCELAFRTITAKAMYVSEPKAKRELVPENIQFAYTSGYYHDIGKVLLDGEESQEHCENGVKIFTELYPGIKDMKWLEKKLITDGIADHHERINGFGGPEGKKGDAISYMGRVVAIADLLDNRALSLTSEDPISEALTSLKEDVKMGYIDREFYKAFSSNRSKLKKVFSESMGDDLVIPVTDQWIKRKVTRPMELVYRTACKCGTLKSDTTNHIWLGEMRFRGTKENNLKYDDVKKTITEHKLGQKLGIYFLYELCDAYKRFNACGLKLGGAAMILPTAFTTTSGMAKQVEEILSDEGLSKDELYLIIPDEAAKKKSKTLEKNINECKEKGINVFAEYEFMCFADIDEDAEFEREESIVRAQVRALQLQEKKEAQWDAELEADGNL